MLKIDSLTLPYQGQVIENIYLHIEQGERIALVLKNIEDMDIFAKLLLGKTSYVGRYEFEGHEVLNFSSARGAAFRRNEVVYLDFDIQYQNDLTLEKLIMHSLKYSGIYPSKWKLIIDNSSRILGLLDKKKFRLSDLPEIERLRAYLAKAIAVKPKLVVMKEPLLFFSSLRVEDIMDLLNEIRVFNTAFCILTLDHQLKKAVDRSYNLINET